MFTPSLANRGLTPFWHDVLGGFELCAALSPLISVPEHKSPVKCFLYNKMTGFLTGDESFATSYYLSYLNRLCVVVNAFLDSSTVM